MELGTYPSNALQGTAAVTFAAMDIIVPLSVCKFARAMRSA